MRAQCHFRQLADEQNGGACEGVYLHCDKIRWWRHQSSLTCPRTLVCTKPACSGRLSVVMSNQTDHRPVLYAGVTEGAGVTCHQHSAVGCIGVESQCQTI
ncbi:hypothetical protein BaRGS_00001337 [Batillaria attramentaria]|uniref:Uncharacterized protein n=1 Tax=Batillaria attramentaria TaxID=370345 RepID=A0ABD0M7U2_9CAEN